MTTLTNISELTNAPKPRLSLAARISRMHRFWWRLVMTAGALIVVGSLMIWDTRSTDHVEHHSLVALESGRLPDGNLVQVSGEALDIVVVESDSITHRPQKYYVPIVSVNWQHGDEVYCVAEMSPADYDAMIETGDEIVPIKGMAIKHFRLDGEVRRLFEGIEPSIDLASSYIVINERSDPVVMRRSGISAAGVGGVLLAIAIAMLYLQNGEPDVDDFAGDRALRAAMGDASTSRYAQKAAQRDMGDCDDAVRQWCQSRGFSGYQER